MLGELFLANPGLEVDGFDLGLLGPSLGVVCNTFRLLVDEVFEVLDQQALLHDQFLHGLGPSERKMSLEEDSIKARDGSENSARKTDKVDARLLACQLAIDEVPEAYRPNKRQREHRRLVRRRAFLQRRISALKTKMRRILADHNADFPELFGEPIDDVIERLDLPDADAFVLKQLATELELFCELRKATDKQLTTFAKSAGEAEAKHREVLASIPQVAAVTIDVVLAELAGPERFRSQKAAVSYAGLVPGIRESAGKRKELHIEKTGSPLLRWVLIETAWRRVQRETM